MRFWNHTWEIGHPTHVNKQEAKLIGKQEVKLIGNGHGW